MPTFQEMYDIPNHLAERIRVISPANTNKYGSFILYWMHHGVRTDDNPALDTAILVANQLGLPILVYQGLGGKHKYNSDRHHTFIMQGARVVQQQLREKGIRYSFHLSEKTSTKSPLYSLAEQAALLITEDFPAPPFPKWTKRLADTIEAPVWAIDTHCILPMQQIGKSYQRAFAFRNAVKEDMLNRIAKEWPVIDKSTVYFDGDVGFKEVDFGVEPIHELCARCDIDHSVAPIHQSPGGSIAGYKRWSLFKEHGLATYHKLRNNATVRFPQGVSRMSAYLHHGHVSPFRLAREASQSHTDGAEKYLDELLIWRELAFNLCFYNSDVESIGILPSWARSSLLSRTKDPRPAFYSLEALERGETDDSLWNAAQNSLLTHGELHNNVRMTWGKAVLQWTQSPQEALDILIHLNHRYALDGSDPNSYGGILWCLGLFDRPFSPEKPIFGTVRTRPSEHHQRRLNMQAYEAHVHRSPRNESMRVAIIGAGLAGLAAARSLQNNGINVTLFDKSRGPGGRMATRRVEDMAFDHGAQYFTVRDDRFQRQVHSWLQEGIAQEWQGSIGTVKDGTIQKKNVSTTRYVGVPRMSAITRSMSASLDIKFKTRIIDSHFDGHQWEITDENQMIYSNYDALIITTPPDQALPFLDRSPILKKEVASINMQPCWAVMASFSSPLPISIDGLFVEDSPLSWICRNNSKPERPRSESWVLHGSPEWSSNHLEKNADEILPLLLAAFFDAAGIETTKPDFAKAHRWRYALAENPSTQEHFWDESNRLAVCGDWCNGSRIEGAYLSGVAAAGRIAGLPDTLKETAPNIQLSIPGL